jgi:invasion protein IalB
LRKQSNLLPKCQFLLLIGLSKPKKHVFHTPRERTPFPQLSLHLRSKSRNFQKNGTAASSVAERKARESRFNARRNCHGKAAISSMQATLTVLAGASGKTAQFGERFDLMVFARLVRAATFGVAATLALSLGMSGAMAQSKEKGSKAPAAGQQQAAAGEQQHPDLWYKLCIDVPTPEPTKPGEAPKQQKPEEMKKVNVCLTQVDVRDNATAILIGKIAVRQVAGQDKPQMLAMLPLGSALPPGALVKIDDKEPIKLAYTTCDQAGCYAEANIEPAMVEQMKSGKQIAYLGIDVTGRALSIPLPLEGFAKAIDGKPIPVEKYNEDQRKIAEVIRTRLAELRKKQEEAAAAQSGNAQAAAPAPAKSDKKSK